MSNKNNPPKIETLRLWIMPWLGDNHLVTLARQYLRIHRVRFYGYDDEIATYVEYQSLNGVRAAELTACLQVAARNLYRVSRSGAKLEMTAKGSLYADIPSDGI